MIPGTGHIERIMNSQTVFRNNIQLVFYLMVCAGLSMIQWTVVAS